MLGTHQTFTNNYNLLRWSLKLLKIFKRIKKWYIIIYSVGVWNFCLKPKHFLSAIIIIYSVGVWNATRCFLFCLSYRIIIYSVGVWNSVAKELFISLTSIIIYSVGVWNLDTLKLPYSKPNYNLLRWSLKLVMSMFEVEKPDKIIIYSVGVWNVVIAPATFIIIAIIIYSVGVWNLERTPIAATPAKL